MAEATSARSGEKEGLLNPVTDDMALREKVADGIAIASKDASVSESQTTCIAYARSVLLATLLAVGVGAMMVLAQSVSIVQGSSDPLTWRQFGGNLTVDICSKTEEMKTSSASINRTAWMGGLSDVDDNKFKFVPVGATAQKLGLTELRYYSSEEVVGEDAAAFYLALSFGAFSMNPTTFNVVIEGEGNCSDPAARLAEAIAAALRKSGRREPRTWIRTGLWDVHGALLLKMAESHPEDPFRGEMWDSLSSRFVGTYQRSRGWNIQQTSLVLLTFALSILAAWVLYASLAVEWQQAVRYWVAKYDWLWAVRALRPTEEQLAAQDRLLTAEAQRLARPREARTASTAAADPDTPFADRIQLASLFFLLDDCVGNAQWNSERWDLALRSTLVHATALLAALLVPLSMTIFIKSFLPLFEALAFLHGVTATAFAVAYYNSVPFQRRAKLMYLHYFVMALCMAWTLMFLVASLLFMVGRILVEPEKVLGIAVPIVSIAVYAIVIFTQLRAVQAHYEAAMKGEASRGYVAAFLDHLQLSTSKIILIVLLSVVILILLTISLLSLIAMHKDKGSAVLSDPVTAITVPFVSVGQALAVVWKKRSSVDQEIETFRKVFQKIV